MNKFFDALKGLEGKIVLIRLKNGLEARGKAVMIDPQTMNVLLNDADLKNANGSDSEHFGVLIIRGDQVSLLAPLS
jgi:small nuclear ribonucleoprotein (snRNP)-like protein